MKPFPFLRQPFVFVILCVASAMMLLSGQCNNQDNQPIANSNEITFWHFRSEPKQREALRAIVARFEQEHDCKVKLVDLSWGDGKVKLVAAFNSGTAPDVLELGSDWVAQFSHGGVLMNLSKAGLHINNFAEFTHSAAKHRDSIFALPWTVDTRVMFYNKALLRRIGLEKPPTTADELLRASRAIQALGDEQAAKGITDRIYGFGANGSDEHRLYKRVLPMFWSAGGDVLSDSGRPVINSKQNIDALQTYCDLSRAGFIETQRQLDNVFVRGNLGFWISGAWLLDKIKKENPSLPFSVALIPAFGEKSSSFAGVEYVAINYKTRNASLARRFALYITSGENALALLKQFQDAGIPADKRYMRDEYVLSAPYRGVFVEQLLTSHTSPIHPRWLDIERVVEDAIVEALYGIKSPEQALNSAQWFINDIVSRP
jgi:multiple sugar transport system substrate-binding protein